MLYIVDCGYLDTDGTPVSDTREDRKTMDAARELYEEWAASMPQEYATEVACRPVGSKRPATVYASITELDGDEWGDTLAMATYGPDDYRADHE